MTERREVYGRYRGDLGETWGRHGETWLRSNPNPHPKPRPHQVHEAYDPGALQQFHVDMSKLAAFRYRVDDALRAVTRHALQPSHYP